MSRRTLKDIELSLSLPVVSTSTHLLPSRPQLQRNNMLKLDEEVICTLGEDISLLPAVTHSTMSHLSYRNTEISQWQAQMSESIRRVDQEISAVEQVKAMTEARLQEKQLYSQHMSECVALSSSLNSEVLRRDSVFTELKKEDQLNNEVGELLQKNISILLNKISTLNEMRAQLLADFQDKGEAIKLTTKCITHDLNSPSSRLPASQYKPNNVSYDRWLSHCRDLKLTADSLMKDSYSFRGNLRFTLANMKNVQQHQRHSTDEAMRKKIKELNNIQDTLIWERQRLRDEISDLMTDVRKVQGQIMNCDSKLNQATHRLDFLNQRPRRELCLDQPYISLTLEKYDLANMTAGLQPVLKRSQQDLDLTHKRLEILEDKLAKNTRALEVQQKCQHLHQSFLPVPNTTVVLANRPRLCTSTAHPTALSYLH